MARGSYLREIARRAVHAASGIRPARHLAQTPSEALPEHLAGSAAGGRTQAPTAAEHAVPHGARGAEHAAAAGTPATEHAVPHGAPDDSIRPFPRDTPGPALPARRGPSSSDAGNDVLAAPATAPSANAFVRPSGGFVPVAGQGARPSRTEASPGQMRQAPSPAEASVTAPDNPEPNAPKAAAGTRAVIQDRKLPRPRDPLAAALAVALRWTSSPEPRLRPVATERAQERGDLAPATSSRTRAVPRSVSESSAPEAPPRVAEPARLSPRPLPRAEPTSLPTHDRPTQALPPAKPPEIRIGSIEVHVLPAPVKPPVMRPSPASSAAPVARLARELTSSIGLRQS